MKLIQINTALNNSSTGKIANQIGDLCIDNGWESYLAYGGRRPRVDSRSKVIKIGNRFDTYWHALMTKLFDRNGF